MSDWEEDSVVETKPSKSSSGGWNTENTENTEWNASTNQDNGWGSNSGEKSERDARPKRKEWICNSCQARVFGSNDSCYKCNEPKGDSKDAPYDGGRNGGGNRRPDWICSNCEVRVFANRTNCFKCNEPKGDSKDAPDDGGKRENWTCASCDVEVFASRNECFKCKKPKSEAMAGSTSDGFGDSNNSDAKEREEWTCECGQTNFANRDKCRGCSQAKPRKEGDPEPREYYCPEALEESALFGTGISVGINFEKFDKIPVEVVDEARKNPPRAIPSFAASGLNDLLLENLKKSNYKNPTPIQKNSIPIVLAKRDLMACAQTGSGKTAAFLLPIIHTLMNEQVDLNNGEPYALIVTPTRELTTQIFNEARKFAQGSIIRCSQVYGGTSTRYQRDNVNCHILVATPGRLMDFIEKEIISLRKIRFVVLDEADRMLDMGFKESVNKIMSTTAQTDSGERQTLMFSATFPEEIRKLARVYLKDSIFLKIGLVGGACADVTQTFFQVEKVLSKKRDKLMEILNESDPKGTMVFVETKTSADRLAVFLSESEHPTTSIHGDRKQSQREEALRDFKSGKMKVLIATAVAARGLDIPGVRHVINFDIPKTIDEYVHRIGRTGRVGNIGKATSFYCPETDAEMENDLVRVLKEANQPIPDFMGGGGGGSSGNDDFRSSSAGKANEDDEEW